MFVCSHESNGGLGWDVAVTCQGLRLVAGKLDWDSEFSLQGVKHVPVGASFSRVVTFFSELGLEHSDLAHSLVYVADFGLDEVNGVVHWVPNLRLSDGVLGHPPVIPRQDRVVNWIL